MPHTPLAAKTPVSLTKTAPEPPTLPAAPGSVLPPAPPPVLSVPFCDSPGLPDGVFLSDWPPPPDPPALLPGTEG